MQKGVLLVHAGSPKNLNPKEIKNFLDEVMIGTGSKNLPYWFSYFDTSGITIRSRPEELQAAYKKVWTGKILPLQHYSKLLTQEVQSKTNLPVALAMLFGQQSIRKALQEFAGKNVKEVLVIPLFPQYLPLLLEVLHENLKKFREGEFNNIEISVLPPFYEDPGFIDLLSKMILKETGGEKPEHLLFCFPGIPEEEIFRADPSGHCEINNSCCFSPSPAHKVCYRHQCLKTAELISSRLQLRSGSYSVAFQSPGKNPVWLQPEINRHLQNLAKQEVKNIVVSTPGFVTDCFKTLYEINTVSGKIFLEAGGQKFLSVPSPNNREDWAEVISHWIDHWRIVDIKTAIA